MALFTGLRYKCSTSVLARYVGSWATVNPEKMCGKNPGFVQNFGMV